MSLLPSLRSPTLRETSMLPDAVDTDRRTAPMNDHHSVFQIIVWFLFVVATLSLCARLGMKYAMTRKLGCDDWLMLAAQPVYLAQCISVSLGASQALGWPIEKLTEDAIESLLKAEYASTVFQLTALALIKWSITAFIGQLSPSSTHHRVTWILRIVIGIWLTTGLLTTLFQCALPRPWDYVYGSRCIDRRAWWVFISLVNVTTELSIVALYISIISALQISLSKRVFVLLIFSTRVLVAGLAIAQLTTFLNASPSADPTNDLWLPSVLNQATLSASVVTACGPYLKPFMESLESGVARVENLPGSEDDFAQRSGPRAYYLSDLTSSEMCSSRGRETDS